MTQSELEQFRLKIKQDYVKLLDLLARVLAADNYLSFGDDNERLLIARGLTNKFIEHAVTILYLSRGTKQDLLSFQFDSYLYDFASIDVLTRASLEAFLTFHYVFYVPQTKEEKDYRYWAYKAAEKKELNKLRQQLESNVVFQELTKRKQKLILKGRWRLQSWREIAIDAGFSEMIASDVYSLLSGQAHSSFRSIAQSLAIITNGGQEGAISTSMGIMNPVIANMVREYCGLFPKAQEVLSKDSEGGGLVDWWIQIDRGLDEFTNIGQDND